MTCSSNLWRSIQRPQDVRVYSWASHCLLMHRDTCCMSVHQCHSQQLTFFHPAATCLPYSAHSQISTEIAPESRPAPTSHSTWWTTLTPHRHQSQLCSSLWYRPVPAQPGSPPHQPPAHPWLPPSKSQKAQALTRQDKAAGSHNNPLCGQAHLINSTKTLDGNSQESRDAPLDPPVLQVMALKKDTRTSHPKEEGKLK